MDKLVCQSCGMPMEKFEDFGTNADGSQSQEYCRYCYQNGQFTISNVTLEEYIEKMVAMAPQMGMSEEQAREWATRELPKLKRWAAAPVAG